MANLRNVFLNSRYLLDFHVYWKNQNEKSKNSFSCAGMPFCLFPCLLFPNSESFSGLILPEKGGGTGYPLRSIPAWPILRFCPSMKKKTGNRQNCLVAFFFSINPYQSLLIQFQYTHSHMPVGGCFCSPFALLIHPGYF